MMGFNPNYIRLVTVTTHVIPRVEGVSRTHMWTRIRERSYFHRQGSKKVHRKSVACRQ